MPRFPYPVIGGDRLRIFQICKALAEHYELILVSLSDDSSDLKFNGLQYDIFKEIHVIYLPVWKSLLNCALGFFGKKPLQVLYYECQQFGYLINQLHIANPFDAIFCHLIRTAQYAEDFNCIKFLEMTDAISMNYERVAKNPSKVHRLKSYIYEIEFKRVLHYERNVPKLFDKSFMVSSADKDFLYNSSEENYKDLIKVAENGVDFQKFKYINSRRGKDIIFIGNLYSVQNMDAAYYFAENILPLILKKIPSVNFKVVGKITHKNKIILEKFKNVIVTEEVDDVNDHTISGFVGVCPVRLAAGIQNKNLEYMSLGLPVVTTSVGAEGLCVVSGRDLLIADSPEEFCSKIIMIFEDKAFANSLAISARNLIENQYAWKSKLAPLINEVRSLV